MKWIKNLAFFVILTFAFLFSTTERKAADKLVQKSAKNSIEKIDYLRANVFVKPQISSNIFNGGRDSFPLLTKWFESFFDLKQAFFTTLSNTNLFVQQDINRCLNVSILLFPYHLFW